VILVSYEYVKGILLKDRQELTQESDWLSQEVKTYRNAISNAESKSVNDLSDFAMDVAMNLKEYRDRLEYLEARLDFILDKIKEIDMAIKTLKSGEDDV
jgi:chromosome segregation ATPase